MSISQKLENSYNNVVYNIKKMKNGLEKDCAIGALIKDVGNRSISSVAKLFGICFRKAKKCLEKFENGVQLYFEFRGRKKITEIFPELKNDIKQIIDKYSSVDPRFKSEIQYVNLSINEIKKQLIETGKYYDNSFSNSTLNNIVNKMGYNLKKVSKTKPLKKIAETDNIFKNVHKKKEEAMKDERVALISIDTKDKVLLGPFSRNGKNRFQVNAVDHELTNNCLIPFGILDLKTNKSYFFNFKSKPTSLDIIDCIEEFYAEQYKNTKINKLVILLDNGPDNSGVRTTFIKGLIEISNKYNIIIDLAYYPPYHSKYNPVERLWARLEKIWNGFLLINEEICLNFMSNLTWNTVKSTVKLKETKYSKGMTVDKKEMEALELAHIIRIPSISNYPPA